MGKRYYTSTRLAICLAIILWPLLRFASAPCRSDAQSLGNAAFAAPNNYYISGIVRDSLTFEPLPYASVTLLDLGVGALANENGIFELTVPVEAATLQVSCLGYEKKLVPVKKGMVNLYDIHLSPSQTVLKEVVVRKQKYSKKNNPAVEFVTRLRNMGEVTDPKRNPYYSYSEHELITIALNEFASPEEKSALFKKFPFLWEHVDTSEVSGKPILPVITKEKKSSTYFRKSPKSQKEIIHAVRQEGVDELTEQASVNTFFHDMLREVNLYDNDINILKYRFVSPLSRIAPDFYRFYLTDTVDIGDEKYAVLSFYPRNPASYGFNGQVYVPVGDSTMFIKKVTMRTPRNINLNFIDNLYISQEFDRAPDGSRLKKSDDLTIEIKIVGGTSGLYARRSIAYADHSFDAPSDSTVFNGLGTEITERNASKRDNDYWDGARLINMTDNEKRVDSLMYKLRQQPLYYWGEKALQVLVNGYVPIGKPSVFDYGPVNTSFSHNTIEGWRLRAGGLTTANLNKRIFARGYVAYGTRDHKWKYSGELEYSFVDKDYHSREFPIHSLRFTSLYDVNHIGQHYLFTNQDNFFLSLQRKEDPFVTYHNVNKLDYTLELANNFSIVATLQNEIQNSTPFMPFIDGNGHRYGNYSETSIKVQLRYAPGEKYFQTKTYRIPINLDAPIFILSHVYAPKGVFGSPFAISTTEASVQKRFWLSAFGYIDIVANGGHAWTRTPFPSLLIPNANISYTIQPESYACMNPLEFINDSYASIDFTYWANGAIFNYIPYVKKLKLREVFAFRGLWGTLSSHNDPAKNPSLLAFPAAINHTPMDFKHPYMEVSVGLDNIFKCLRVDYVWRLSYLDVPYSIDRRGLRIALHFTF